MYVDHLDCERRAGAKLLGLIDLLVHCFEHDDIGMPIYVRGEDTEWPAAPETENPWTRKIVVWHEFTMMADLIASVGLLRSPSQAVRFLMLRLQALTVNNIATTVLNGRMNAKKRAAAVEIFKTDDDAEVLLMSSVGMVGLNLTCADVVIAYVSLLPPPDGPRANDSTVPQDLPWSQIDMQQLWGRVHRYGQRKPTWAFRMIAMATFDEWMHAGGAGKVDLAEDFLSRPENKSTFACPSVSLKGKLIPVPCRGYCPGSGWTRRRSGRRPRRRHRLRRGAAPTTPQRRRSLNGKLVPVGRNQLSIGVADRTNGAQEGDICKVLIEAWQ